MSNLLGDYKYLIIQQKAFQQQELGSHADAFQHTIHYKVQIFLYAVSYLDISFHLGQLNKVTFDPGFFLDLYICLADSNRRSEQLVFYWRDVLNSVSFGHIKRACLFNGKIGKDSF